MTNSAFRWASWGVSSGGTVFGMSMTVVTPPATAALLACAQSSLWVNPGVRKCTWESMRPGSRYRPPPSRVRTAGGRSSGPRSRAIRPSATAIPPGTTPSPVTSRTPWTTSEYRSRSGAAPSDFGSADIVGLQFHPAERPDLLAAHADPQQFVVRPLAGRRAGGGHLA